jgi:hypothetical protein
VQIARNRGGENPRIFLGFRLPPFCTTLQEKVAQSSKNDTEVAQSEVMIEHGNQGSSVS